MAALGPVRDDLKGGVDQVAGVIEQTVNSVFNTLLGKTVTVVPSGDSAGCYDDMKEWIKEPHVFGAGEATEGYQGNIIFVMKSVDAAKFSRLILGEELSADVAFGDGDKDSVAEMINQVFGNLSTDLGAALSQSFAFGQAHIEPVEPEADLPPLMEKDDELVILDYTVTVEGVPEIPLRVLIKQGNFSLGGAADGGLPGGGIGVQPVSFGELDSGSAQTSERNVEMIMDIPVLVSVELGVKKMPIREILDLGQGAIIELNKMAGETVDVLVNNALVAKGEVVVIDEYFGVRVTEIADARQRIESLRT